MTTPYDFLGTRPQRRSDEEPQFIDPDYSDWKAYVIGGVIAVLVLVGLILVSSSDPNQQTAQNQPQVERQVDRSPAPPNTPTPPPSTTP
jgi:hypothetical protein